jgi:TRAP-type C4-dicarboxylate transport system substrate-binding protein
MKTKRSIDIFFVFLLIAVLIIPASMIETASAGEPQPGKIFNWKLQCAFPPPEKVMGYWSTYGLSREIARKVKERTNGKLDIKVYSSNVLFKVHEAPEAVKRGALEMVASNGSYHASILPEATLEFGLPYGAKSSDQVYKLIYHTDYLNILRQAYADKHHVYLLGLGSGGSYNYLTRFPIRSMADLKGRQIRSAGSYGQIARAHGANPVNISGAEQYTALQRGTVDGTIYPPHTGISYKVFEVVKYQSWPPICAVIGFNILVNLDAWKGLPKEYQEILQEEVDKMVKYTFEISGPSLENLARVEGKKQFGAESIYLSDAEYARFRNAVVPIWNEWAARSDSCAKLVKIAKDSAGIK